MQDSGSPPRALPLITFDPHTNQYECGAEALEVLRATPGPLGVVACAGKYRTGKSFLLNRVILRQRGGTGFGVGNTVQACTKGLWIWSQPIMNKRNMRVFVVDTEGIGALDASSTHDARIFSLAILLSSSFFYNSVGSIDDTELQQLSLVCALSKHIKMQSSDAGDADPAALAEFFPELLWVVRDFSLQLKRKDGTPMTETEYLENALADVPANLEGADQKNQTRQLLRTYFRNRDCTTMVRPTNKESDLQNLDHVEKLRAEFVRQGKRLRRRLVDACSPKCMRGTSLNGAMLAGLCDLFVEAINGGGVPAMDDALTSILRLRVLKIQQETRAWFDDRVSAVPMTTPADVRARVQSLVDQTLRRFDKETEKQDAGLAARASRDMLSVALGRAAEERVRMATETHRVKLRGKIDRELRRDLGRMDSGSDLPRVLEDAHRRYGDEASDLLWEALREVLAEPQMVDRLGASSELQTQLDELRVRHDDALQKHERETQAMRQSLADTQNAHENDLDELRHQLATRHEEEEELRRRMDEVRDECATLQEDVATFRDRAVALEEENVRCRAVEQENAQMREEADTMRDRLEEHERSFRAATERLRCETVDAIQRSKQQQKAAQAELEVAQQELKESRTERTRLDAQLDQLKAHQQETALQHETAVQKLMQETRTGADAHRREMTQLQEKSRARHQELERQATQQERDAASLKRRLERTQEELEESRKRPRVSPQMTLDLARVRKELEWSEQQRSQLTARCDELKTTVADLRDQLRQERQAMQVEHVRKSLRQNRE